MPLPFGPERHRPSRVLGLDVDDRTTGRVRYLVPAGASSLRALAARGLSRSAEKNSSDSTRLVGYRCDTPSACWNVMVRPAMASTVPSMREPSLMTSVSADTTVARDTTTDSSPRR